MNTGKYRYVVAGLLFTAGAINYMDRAALGIVAPIVGKTLELSPSQLGIIFSSFFIGYSIFSFLGGYLHRKTTGLQSVNCWQPNYRCADCSRIFQALWMRRACQSRGGRTSGSIW